MNRRTGTGDGSNKTIDLARASQIAEAAMSRALGDFAILHGVEQLSDEGRRNLILRAQAHVGGRSRSIIIKATRSRKYEASSADIFAGSGLVREWVAPELLAQSPEHNSSALLAGDAEHGLIVFDDFGSDLPSMDAMLLRGTPAAAEAALVAYATALGRLHVATIDSVKSHAAIIRKTFSAAAIPVCAGGDWMEAPLPEIDGVTIPEVEANFIRSRLVEPGQWLALVHGDSCPYNVLFNDGRATLIDFEFSAPGHMLLDAAYWRLGCPTCWCAGIVPAEVADRLDALYRDEVKAVLPEITDDQIFAKEMAIISMARTLHNLRWLLDSALAKDSNWGIASRRSRILWYLEAAIAACRKADILRGTCVTMQVWRDHLAQRWPDSHSLAMYPAFANSK